MHSVYMYECMCTCTIDREIFAELYFCVLNFNFRYMAFIYIVDIAR